MPSVGVLICSKNPVDARECFFQQRAKSLNMTGALTIASGRRDQTRPNGPVTYSNSLLIAALTFSGRKGGRGKYFDPPDFDIW